MTVEQMIHPLWTKAVGTPDYDKQQWLALQVAIEHLERDNRELRQAHMSLLANLASEVHNERKERGL